ncbi:hypothetical protein [Raineya sp.]|jgi:hypothetical protein
MFSGLFAKNKAQGNSENFAQVFCKTFEGKNCLYFEFKGVFDDKLATEILPQAEKILQNELKDDKALCVVCSCKEMQDYDPMARVKFQKFLKNYEKNIKTMWVITSSKIIKYGGLLMDLVLPFSVKVVESEEQIKF